MVIRKAAEEDFLFVASIMQEVHDLHVAWRPDIYRPSEPVLSKENYLDMIQHGTCLVAEQDHEIVGICSFLHRHIASEKHVTRNILFVDDLAVKEEVRGSGIGTALLRAVKAQATAERLDGIELQVNAKNLRAVEMYEKNGFSVKSINMELL